MMLIKQNESTAARRRLPVYLVDATDGYTPETGISSPTIEVSKNGASQASGGGTFTEIGDGMYYYECSSGEVDTLGFLNVRIAGTGCREFQAVAQVVAFNPYDDLETTVDAILADTNEMQGKLPTNNIMGSSDKDNHDTDIDSILADTNEIQGKLPTNKIMGSSDVDNHDTDIDAILVDTNEIQGKLPTNNIMGSSVKTDKDDEIDAIKVVTDKINFDGSDNVQVNVQAAGVLNNLSAAQVNTEVDTALADARLDELVKNTAGAVKPAVGSIMDQVMNKDGSQTFSQSTDALEAIRDNQSSIGDFTANERTEIKTVLGVTGTGTPNSTPSDGVLKEIQDNVDAVETDTQDIQTRLGTPVTDIYTEMAKDSTVAKDATVAKEANATANTAAIIAEVDANEALINALAASLVLVKAQTDKLTFDGSNNIQARVNNKGVLNDPSASDIDTQLSGTHGAGSWVGTGMSESEFHDALDSYTNKDNWKANVALLALEATAQSIKTKTDNLPVDTAQELTDIDTAIANLTTLIPTDLENLLKQLREGNISYEFVPATVEDAVRKVAVGVLDQMIIKVKNDGDADWSSPVSTKTLYLWYSNLGDTNPRYVKEDG